MSKEERIVLKGEKALEIWRQGREAWNKWVEEHPEADIDFSSVDFSKERNNKNIPEDKWPFAGFHFPQKGTVNFSKATFGEGTVDFRNANFGEGTVSFSGATFGKGYVSFLSSKFKGLTLFHDLKQASLITSFSFRYATFDGPLEISTDNHDAFSCVPDLTNTKTSHHVSLEGLDCILQLKDSRYILKYIQVRKCLPAFFKKDGDWLRQKTAVNKEDAERLRRLKELAENNKDHNKALDFHIMEMQASREFEHSRIWPLPLLVNTEFWFDKLGDYGRNFKQPFSILVFLWVVFSWLYCLRSYIATATLHIMPSLIFGGAQILSFLPTSKTAKDQMAQTLFPAEKISDLGYNIPSDVYLLTFAESLLSLVLIFLMGLALKHKFKL